MRSLSVVKCKIVTGISSVIDVHETIFEEMSLGSLLPCLSFGSLGAVPSGWSSGFTKPLLGVYVCVSVSVAVGGAMVVDFVRGIECGAFRRLVFDR